MITLKSRIHLLLLDVLCWGGLGYLIYSGMYVQAVALVVGVFSLLYVRSFLTRRMILKQLSEE